MSIRKKYIYTSVYVSVYLERGRERQRDREKERERQRDRELSWVTIMQEGFFFNFLILFFLH